MSRTTQKQGLVMPHKCPFCTHVIESYREFGDMLSLKEYLISGLCQACQDKTFGGPTQ